MEGNQPSEGTCSEFPRGEGVFTGQLHLSSMFSDPGLGEMLMLISSHLETPPALSNFNSTWLVRKSLFRTGSPLVGSAAWPLPHTMRNPGVYRSSPQPKVCITESQSCSSLQWSCHVLGAAQLPAIFPMMFLLEADPACSGWPEPQSTFPQKFAPAWNVPVGTC